MTRTRHEHEFERSSARQDAKVKMGGIVGEAVYAGEMARFLPLLALAEVLHVGKGTGMGLGRVESNSGTGSVMRTVIPGVSAAQ